MLGVTAFATAQENAPPPDMSSSEIIALKKVILPIEGLAEGSVASVSPLAEQAKALSKASETIAATVAGNEVRLSISGDVLFAFDSDAIEPAGARILADLAAFLRQSDVRSVVVEGHTDSIGSARYNLDLSKRRALSTTEWLVRDGKLTGVAFVQKGYGFERPVADNVTADGADNPEGRRQNRRVEFVLDGG